MTEKEKAYDEAIERAKKYSGDRIVEEIFPELKESEDEKIRKEIISILRNAYWTSNKNRFNELVAWLEKKGEQKPCMIQWKGDNLKEVIGFTGKDKNFGKWFKSFEEYEKYVHEHNDIFKLFNENGNHYEIPVGAWIVKTPDGYNIASNAVLKQKSVNKIEQRFKVSDWVVNKFGDSWHIDSLDKKNYQVSDGKGNYNYFPISKQDEMHLWTIQDAKDGDVIALSWLEDKNLWEKIIIFKKYHSEGVKGLCSIPCVEGYGNTFKNGKMAFTEEVPYHSKTWTCNLHPATKEQRDLLFQKIKEAGYKWNAGTKTLEKLVKPKFKIGDKINLRKYMDASGTEGIISEITEDKYIFTDNSSIYISSQDSWELVHDKKSKFDPKTLQPFDRVLARDNIDNKWECSLFSRIIKHESFPFKCVSSGAFRYCIPYNNDTKYLVGTTDEAPEFYKYWEE